MADHETIPVRLKALELQMGRLESDYESEKDTRARSNDRLHAALGDLERQQRRTERIVWMSLGALALLQFLTPLVLAWYLRRP